MESGILAIILSPAFGDVIMAANELTNAIELPVRHEFVEGVRLSPAQCERVASSCKKIPLERVLIVAHYLDIDTLAPLLEERCALKKIAFVGTWIKAPRTDQVVHGMTYAISDIIRPGSHILWEGKFISLREYLGKRKRSH